MSMDPNHQNNLAGESSPYLLQHAHNPVDWYPWGKEAFEKARQEDKPVFLSIGYATCHWCHVMAHESFEDEAVAALMNNSFINIKVDREERPDIDNTYIHVCQILTGRAGWPLTILMTPEKKPFYAATYIPKRGRQGQPGMMELLPRLKQLWDEERNKIHESAREITSAFQQSIEPQNNQALPGSILKDTVDKLSQQFDRVHGGFGGQPKFPMPHTLSFLLRYSHAFDDEEAKVMAEKTLTGMRRGGLFDHLGGGFHRYSTDSKWLLPHFEKMLYDQAIHLLAYTEGYQSTGNPLFKQTSEEIAGYLLRDMQDDNGGFYSAEDADSEGEEGTFYVWSVEEVRKILSVADAELAIEVFNMQEDGNYADESTGKRTGKNILHRTKTLAELADERNLDEKMLRQKLGHIKEQLFEAREKRERPFLDDKILTDWNGLIIAALAKAGRTLNHNHYITQAERAANIIFDQLTTEKGRLLHRYRKGEAQVAGTADDYAFLIWGLLELYESTFATDYLKKAVDLQEVFLQSHWDEEHSGFFFTSTESEQLLGHKKEYMDNALPSGNSVAAMNLLRLGRITATPEWEVKAEQIVQSTSETTKKAPTSFTQLLQAHLWASQPSFEIVIAGNQSDKKIQSFIKQVHQHYELQKVVLLNEPKDTYIERLAPYTKQQTVIDDQPTAYVCKNYSCDLPVHNARDLEEQLTGN